MCLPIRADLLSSLLFWWLLLCLSVLFVHQHHLLDIAGGLVLAGMLCRFYSAASD